MNNKGLTLVETIVALAVFSVVATLPLALFIPASQTDSNARMRTLALRADETWLDRYRSNQEQPISGGACTLNSNSTILTCNYPLNYSYATPELTSIMNPSIFSHVITVTGGAAGTNVHEWQVIAKTSWKQGGKTYNTQLTTRVSY
ncbi:type IV pilus modification PilV family protein [Deinococcus ruber]|uniref:Prepilin-type N-terminal cleavage/methylation domain-containing protein n=1 Tax=Deinococcus ruber TaxID=1848197 RepID=A0A918F753_9DEIO|nr:hypothetical protein GCM10008957_20390 [Deinococcus ruber]